MWILHLLSTVFAGTATLHVGVHRHAGSIYDIAVDGASGQCVVLGQSRLRCPAEGAVRFRFGPDGPWMLHGDTEVLPGEQGTAFVLWREGARREDRESLVEATPERARELFVRTGARELQPLTPGLLQDLLELTTHEDWRVRREVVRGLFPYVRHTASDPFPSDAPSLIPPGVLTTLGTDPDRRVRRRTAALLREMGPEDPHAAEAGVVRKRMLTDANPGVRRLALTGLTVAAREEGADALAAWRSTRKRVSHEGPPGRAACSGLARLHGHVDPNQVDADGALAAILQHHPEKAWRFWGAWRDELPFDGSRVELMLRETEGLSIPLLRHWAGRNPVELREVLERWEPGEPHSERWRVLASWVEPKAVDPDLRRILALDDSLSAPSGGPEGE